jgi:hypothetical protein
MQHIAYAHEPMSGDYSNKENDNYVIVDKPNIKPHSGNQYNSVTRMIWRKTFIPNSSSYYTPYTPKSPADILQNAR